MLTRKLLMRVAPTRMGYRLTMRKLSPNRKLPLMATTAAPTNRNSQYPYMMCVGKMRTCLLQAPVVYQLLKKVLCQPPSTAATTAGECWCPTQATHP